MANLSGTNVAAPLAPFSDADTYPTHDPIYGIGGYREVATLAARDAIPAGRRRAGMMVVVTADSAAANNKPWRLLADLTTWEDASNNTEIAAQEAAAAQDAAALAEQKRADAASAASQAALDAATASAQRAAAELARALAEAAQTNTEQVVASVRGKTSRSDVPFAFTDDVGFWLAYLTALGDLVTVGGKLGADGSLDTNLLRMLNLSGDGFRLKDAAGFVRFLIDAVGGLYAPGIGVTPNGLITAGGTIIDPTGILQLGPHRLAVDGTLSLPQIRIAPTSAAGVRFRDEAGFIAWQVDNTGLASGSTSGGTTTTGFTADEIRERDARARAASAEPSRGYSAIIAPLAAQIVHFLVYGQSLSCGYEGHPAVSITPQFDNLMLGDSVHYAADATLWKVIGTQQFNPLKATVVNTAGSGLATDTEVAALAIGDDNRGETVGEAALSWLRRAYLDGLGLAADPNRRFLLSEAGSGGQTIEVLSKAGDPTNNGTTRYPRIVDCATKAKATATAAGLSYGVGAYLWLQGEANFGGAAGDGIAHTSATYKALLYQLKADLHADIAQGLAGQSRPAAFFTYQTGGTYVRQADPSEPVGVAQGQYEFALENEDVVMVAPAYPLPDNYGHLTSNGYRWLGEKFGQVMHEVLIRRRRWRPLSPLRASRRGREILLDFHVPAPPLQWGLPWLMLTGTDTTMTALDFSNKGFVAEDGSGVITTLTAEIVGDCVVRLTSPRDFVGTVKVRYGTSYTRGSGNLMDSDPALSIGTFTYDTSRGFKSNDNIPSLIGKRYPLNNWCVIFEITATPA